MHTFLNNLSTDIRYALRMMAKSPGFAAIAVVSLALGIGANTAIFTLIDAVMLKMLPVRDPQELYVVAQNPARVSVSWNNPDYEAMRDRNHGFSGLRPPERNLRGTGPHGSARGR